MIARALARIACLTALAVLATIAAPRAARAGEDAATKIAKQHFYQGEKLFALGRFSDALAEYEAAFDAKQLPGFLFNIGQCHRNLHDLDAAIFSYRKYLHDDPDAPNRAEVEDLIRELEDEQAHERARSDQRQTDRARVAVRAGPSADPRAAASTDDPHRPIYTRWWLWTGVAAVAGGTTAYLLTRDRGGVPSTDLGNVVFPEMIRAAAIALGLAAAACSAGVTVTVVTVDARPSVHGAARLEIVLGNASSTLTQDFDLHGHSFPTRFSVTTPGRTGLLTFTARALDESGAVVGLGATRATIVDGDETDVSLRLDPADFPVNTQVAGAQRTVFYLSTGARQLTAAGDGTFTAAWTDDCMTIGRCDEWGRRFDHTGAALTSPIAAGTAQFNLNRTAIYGTDAAIAAADDGALVAVWTTTGNDTGAPDQIACTTLAADGSAAIDAEVILSDGGAPDHPGVAALAGGRFGVVWQENLATDGTPVIRFLVVDKTCAAVTGVATVSLSKSPAPDQPAIAASVDGATAAIVWRAGASLRGRMIDAGLASTGGELTLLSLPGDTIWGAEASPTDGGFAIVYGAQSAAAALPAGGFVLHRIGPTGDALGPESVIATQLPDTTAVAGIARRKDGALAIAWHNCGAAGDGAGCGVLAQLVRPTGLAVGAPIVVDTTTQGDQTDPSIAALPDAFAVTWTDASMVAPDQSMTGIRARVLYPAYDDARGVLGAPCDEASPCGTGLACATGSDGAARCHAACDPAGAAPLCPAGGACAPVGSAGACIF